MLIRGSRRERLKNWLDKHQFIFRALMPLYWLQVIVISLWFISALTYKENPFEAASALVAVIIIGVEIAVRTELRELGNSRENLGGSDNLAFESDLKVLEALWKS
jgi:hypothetical protein